MNGSFFILAFFTLTVFAGSPPRLRVFLDIGHGGKDLGAQGLYGISEKALSLELGKLVRKSLLKSAIRNKLSTDVLLSREKDQFVSLKERVRMANEWGAHLFISLHANSSVFPKANGLEVYFLNSAPLDDQRNIRSIISDLQTTYRISESSRFAEAVFDSLFQKFNSRVKGVRQGPFTVLAGTKMPAVLIEAGYLTNETDAGLLMRESFLKELADAISSGVVSFAVQEKLHLVRKVS